MQRRLLGTLGWAEELWDVASRRPGAQEGFRQSERESFKIYIRLEKC